MKVCPICSSTYDDKVDFCFQDGAPLVPAGGSASTVSPSAAGAVPVEDAPAGGIDAPDLPPWARAAPESDPTELPASPLKPRIHTGESAGAEAPPASGLEDADAVPVPEGPEEVLEPPSPIAAPVADGAFTSPTLIPTGELGDITDEAPLPRPPSAAAHPPAPATTAVRLGADAYDDDELEVGPAPVRGGRNHGLLAVALVVALGFVAVGAWLLGTRGGSSAPDLPAADEATQAAQPAPARTDSSPALVPETPADPAPPPAPDIGPERLQDGADGAEEPPVMPAAPAADMDVQAATAPPSPPGAAERPERAESARRPAAAERDREPSTDRGAGVDDGARAPANPWGGEAASSEPRTGRLTVTTSPAGARVLVDGKAVGSAPWSGTVMRGNHTVRAELDGHKPAARSIELATNQLDLNFTLRPVVVTGQVNIYGTPQAKVFIDGNPVGEIPVTALLSEGAHQFEVVTADGQRFTRKYDIRFSVPGVPVTITLIAQ